MDNLSVEIATPGGLIRPVDDVAFAVAPGETLAIVGESGSGKSLTATTLMGLLPPAARPVSGRALLNGTDLLRLEPEALRKLRGDAIAMIAQDR